MKDAVNQRYIDCVNYLINNNFEKNKLSISRILDLSPSMFSEILKKRVNINVDHIIKLCDNWSFFNVEWIVTGKGEMLKDEAKNNKKQGIDADLKDQHQELQKYLDEHQGNFDINELLSNETEINILKGIVEDYKKQIIEKDRQLSERDKQINKLLDLITK